MVLPSDPDAGRGLILFTCLATYFLSIAMLYQMSPFFQLYAEARTGASAGTVGLIFAVLPFFSFLGALPSGHLVSRLGARHALNGGLLVLATSTLAFGLARSVHWWLFWRAVQGLATAPVYTAISSTLAQTFTGPGEFTRVNGLQEVVANIGFTVGPMLGGALFQFGGFLLPFLISAILHVLLVATFAVATAGGSSAKSGRSQPLLNDEDEDEGDEGPDVLHLTVYSICYRKVLVISGVSVIINATWGGMEPALASHFRATLGNISHTYIGALIALPSVSGALVAMVVPTLSDAVADSHIIVAGFLVFTVGLAAFSVADPAVNMGVTGLWKGSPTEWMLQFAALALAGAAFALVWTPILPSMMDEACERVAATRQEPVESIMVPISAPVASLFNAAMGIGEAVGPILGGLLVTNFGFGGMCLMFCVMQLAYGALLLVEHVGSREVAAAGLQPAIYTPRTRHTGSRPGTPVPQLHLRSAARFSVDEEKKHHEKHHEKPRPAASTA